MGARIAVKEIIVCATSALMATGFRSTYSFFTLIPFSSHFLVLISVIAYRWVVARYRVITGPSPDTHRLN